MRYSKTPPEATELIAYALPLRHRFRGITVRGGVVFRGAAGWAEWSPFDSYDDAEAANWLRAAREAADVGWPEPARDRVAVNCTVPAVGPDAAARIVAASGCRTVKVKVAEPGQRLADDLDRLAAVRDTLGRAGRIRVDANGNWDLRTATDALEMLARFDLEYAEQPCADVTDLAALRRAVGVPIAADESIRRAEDPLRVARLGAADVAVLKVQPLGGVWACLRIAERIGLPVVVSSALESSVGLAAGLALAAALPELPYDCGLATASMFTADLVADPLLPVGGEIVVRRPAPVHPVPAGLLADETIRRLWQDRFARCSRLLEAR